MTNNEIETFIEEMGHIGDDWEPDQVRNVYGSWTLEDALADRKKAIDDLGNIFGIIMNG